MSHKLGDVCTLTTFVAAWAAAARQPEAAMVTAVPFLSDAIGETEDLPGSDPLLVLEATGKNRRWVTRRFVFDAAKIAELKDVIVGSGMKNPTRVEVVTSLFCKCAMAASKANCGYSKPVLMIQMVNMRPRFNPPLPENMIGNFSWSYKSMPREDTLDGLVGALRKGLEDFCDKYTKNKDPKQCYSLLIESMKGAKSSLKKQQKTG